MRIYISTAEHSGFLYARLLSLRLKREHPEAEIFGCAEDSGELAPVGFAAGTGAARGALARIKIIERDVRGLQPDVFLAVAWSEPNILLGLRLSNLKSMRRYFFAPPQLWAWGRWRAALLRRGYHRLYALYPREATLLRSLGLAACFAGNPLTGFLKPYLETKRVYRGEGRRIALLPGSRSLEHARHLSLLKDFGKTWRERNPRDQMVWLFLSKRDAAQAEKFLDHRDRTVGGEERYRELARAHLAVVASGTASLEAALAGTPQVVFYRLPRIEVALARAFTRVERFALPNLVAGGEVVPEFLNPSAVELVEAADTQISKSKESMELAARLYEKLTPLDKRPTFLSM